MSWDYVEFSNQSIDTVLSQARDHLSSLTADQANTAKVTSSNQLTGDARSLVVWSLQPNPPSPATLAGWAKYTWHTDADYHGMYEQLIAVFRTGRLPGGGFVSPLSLYWSRICMSNMHHGTATLSLFWRLEIS